MSSDLEQVTREVWSNYVDLNTTVRIFSALTTHRAYTPIRIVAVGKQGSGKTTFMYYAVKVAYARYLCHADKVRKDECLSHVMKEYRMCLGRDCPRDYVDDRLLSGFYVTIDDVLRRFLNDVKTGEIAKRRVVFLDDAFTPKLWWLMGGEWRALYYASKTFDQFYRDNINVLVLTAPNLSYFTRDYIVNSLVLIFNTVWPTGEPVPYTVVYHYVYPHYTHYDFGKPYLVRVKKLDYVDRVPIKGPYGLPWWLENLITERRQYVLRKTAGEALERVKHLLEEDEKKKEGGEE